jgi:hypothetical protein
MLNKYNMQFVECSINGYVYEAETNTCLKYFKIATAITWANARLRCQQDGGDLISITTKEKWDFVVNYLNCK